MYLINKVSELEALQTIKINAYKPHYKHFNNIKIRCETYVKINFINGNFLSPLKYLSSTKN